MWTLLARWYAHHGYRVLAVHQPGHGRSDGPPLRSVEALADWTLALLDAAGAASAHLVGHSMGSLIALEAASRAPERVTGLVMVGTAYPMKVSDALLGHGARRPGARHRDGQRVLASEPRRQAFVPGPRRLAARRRERIDAPHTGRAAEGNLFEHDFRVCDAYAQRPGGRRQTCAAPPTSSWARAT